jgi:peptidyl-prolyl cis-trans isomerase D
MLQNIRNNSQGLLAKTIIGFIIFVFAIFGLDSIVGTFVNSNVSVSVNGVDIDEFSIENEAQRITQELLSSLGANIDFADIDTTQFREQAISNLVERELIIQTAIKGGMTVSSAMLDRQVAQTPEFQINGEFSQDRARALLTSFGLTPASYRTALLRDSLLNQMLSSYSSSSFVTPAELKVLSRIDKEKRNFRLVRISAVILSQTQNVSDAEIAEYYENNAAQFMQSERVAIQYLELNKNDLLAEIVISEEQINEQYQTEIADLQNMVERRASHILLQAVEADFAEAQALATELKIRIDNGESFEDLAAEYSDDGGSAQFGGDVGYSSGETFVEEFENALAQLALNEVSGPVRTQFGVHLIKLTNITENDIPSLEESRERIERELQSQTVDDIYLARAEELGNLAFESLDLEQPAEALGLQIQTSELFDRSGGIGLMSNPAVIGAAFGPDVLEGLNSEIMSLDESRSIVIHLQEYRGAEARTLAEVRGEIEALLRRKKAEEQARSLGETYLNSMNNDQNISTLLSVQGLEWQNGQNLTRNNSGMEAELIQIIFNMSKPTENETVLAGESLQNGDYVLIELQEVIPGTVEELTESERIALESYLQQQEAVADFNAVISGIQAQADISR